MFPYRKTKYSLDIVFPNKMYGGVYSLGPLIIYNIVNQRKDWYCERIFLDYGKIHAALVGFSLQYELDLAKAIAMKPKQGITFAGGPVAELHTEEAAKHFDFLILGDIEAVLPQVLDAWEKGEKEFLSNIESITGVYKNGMKKVTRAVLQNIDDAPYPLVQPFPESISEDYVFGKCFILETERGCPFLCHFCAIPQFYEGKMKFHSLKYLKKVIDEGLALNHVQKIIIYSPSFVHPQRKELLQYLLEKKIRVSFPSIKAEHMDLETLERMKACGQKSLTIAPECGERLRFTLNKKVKDEQYFSFVERCNQAKIEKLKLYMMIGLPEMKKEDVLDMAVFILEMKKIFSGRLYLSINYFVPKPKTVFAKEVMDKKKIKKQEKILLQHLKNIKIKMPKLSTSHKEWMLLR
ncbi:MAG: Radical SAM protein [archaeon GW2011_AR17]|nr:MAG: Radical SAM protein [archaeon GW2011_AR17]MBS3154604.1 radical SAM protein [Candidatus Woesearchaeota archaeon]HIH14737.1 radical SAM protein [Nanoarchaeota archaeon]HIJ05026.1 radical SAM protein [Nanoarchaeota archaeon]